MYRVHLTEDQQAEWHRRVHQPQVAPRVRDRLEMVRLSNRGWSIPKIAAHLGQHEQTTRFWIKAFLDGSFDALTDKPHTGKKSAVSDAILTTVREWLTEGNQTWNARQIAREVHARFGILRSPAQWRRLLRRKELTYKRTKRTLRHKQNAPEVTAKTEEIATLKKGPQAGG